jgi:hypothetical protein
VEEEDEEEKEKEEEDEKEEKEAKEEKKPLHGFRHAVPSCVLCSAVYFCFLECMWSHTFDSALIR